jgi:hypothetical protein
VLKGFLMTKYPDKLRLKIFKNQIEENKLDYLKDLTDTELLNLLDKTVLPNSVNINSLKQTIMFHLIFTEKQERKENIVKSINKIINFTFNLTKTEKVIIKYGVIKGFKTTLWRKEFFLYLKTPLALKSEVSGRKIMSSYKFKEIFFFAYNLVNRAKNNKRLPKF